MEIVQSKSVAKPIILMKFLDENTLLVVDAETTVRYFNKENLELQNGFKVGIVYKRYKASVVAFSGNGNYLAFLSSDLKESRLFSTQTKKVIAKVDRHHGKVSCVAIDPHSCYMFSCGDDGKSFAFDIESSKLVFTLPLHAGAVNDIAFSDNGNWVATAGFDRKISLFSLVTMTPKNKLKSHSAPVTHLKFFHGNKLISIDEKLSAIIWNIHSGEVLEHLQGIHNEVTALVLDKEERFLFLGTQLGYIIVFDLKTYKLISAKYIKTTSPITSLAFDEHNNLLLIGMADGFIIYYDIFEGVDTLKKLFQEKEFQSIQKVIDANPLLLYTHIYSLIAKFLENSLQKAKIALQKDDKAKAMLIFEQFKHMPSKNKIIQKLIRDYEDFPKFVQFVKEGKFALAYGLANRFPLYKESAIYKVLEKRWKKVFFQAQKYLLDPKTAPLAKEILAPYRGISEKTKLIQEVLSKAEIYKRFCNEISKKEFTICLELAKQNPFLQELPEYESLMKYADGLYIKSQKFMQEGEIHSAIKILRTLQDFEGFKDEARSFMIDLESKAKFYNAVRDNDMERAYDMMAVSEDLMLTKDGVKLQQMWNRDLHTANTAAALGNINGVKTVLQKYMKTSSKYATLATIFAFTYMVQLEDALQRGVERSKIENSIKNYIVNFGVSEQIKAFFNLFQDMHPETKLNLEFLKKGSFTMWRPSMIVDSILD